MNCQHCGSASRSDWGYECGSSSSVGFERSIRCRTKEISNIRQELEESNNRIKRLEEDSQRLNWLLNRGLAWRDCYDDWWKKGEWLYVSQSALETIDKAREAKP